MAKKVGSPGGTACTMPTCRPSGTHPNETHPRSGDSRHRLLTFRASGTWFFVALLILHKFNVLGVVADGIKIGVALDPIEILVAGCDGLPKRLNG